MLAKIKLNFVTFLLHGLVLWQNGRTYIFLLSSFHLFDSVFLGIVWIGLTSCVVALKEFVSIFNKETRKRNFLTFHDNGC